MINHKMTRDELRELMCEAITEAFVRCGIQADDPIRMQTDFRWLREARERSESLRRKVALTLIGLLVTGLAAATWVGLQSLVADRARPYSTSDQPPRVEPDERK